MPKKKPSKHADLIAGLRRIAEPKIALPAEYDRLTPVQKRWTRDEYARRQGGLCLYCKTPLKGEPAKAVSSKRLNKARFPAHFFDYPLHLHHDHRNGMTLGVVHAICNAVLWTYHGE